MTSSQSQVATIAESVHARLQEDIFSGAIGPGDPLSVPAFAARLKVSRSPVREAVQQLVFEGLAVYTPHAGAKVASLDEHALRNVFEIREALEGLACRRAATEARRVDIESLREHLTEQEAALGQAPDTRRDSLLDLEFHTLLRDIAGSSQLSEALARLDTQTHMYRRELWSDARGRQIALTEHQRIVDAVEAGRADEAGRAASAHVNAVFVRLQRK